MTAGAEKKEALIGKMNPTWEDLAESEIPRQARDDGRGGAVGYRRG